MDSNHSLSVEVDPGRTAPTHAISWGAVLAGTAAAIALQIAFAEVCLGFGLSLWDPGKPAAAATGIAVGTALVWVASGILALFAGGWVAGRLARRLDGVESALHGALVWAVGAIAGALLAATAVGTLAGGAVSLVGEGLGGIAEAAKIAAPDWTAVRNQVQDALAKAPAANDENRLADQARLMELLGASFTTDGSRGLVDAERAELIGLIASQTGVSAVAAERAYGQWQRTWQQAVNRYQAAVDEAKETAKTAKRRTAQAAIWAFMAMVVGLAAAAGGGRVACACGRQPAQKRSSSPPVTVTYA